MSPVSVLALYIAALTNSLLAPTITLIFDLANLTSVRDIVEISSETRWQHLWDGISHRRLNKNLNSISLTSRRYNWNIKGVLSVAFAICKCGQGTQDLKVCETQNESCVVHTKPCIWAPYEVVPGDAIFCVPQWAVERAHCLDDSLVESVIFGGCSCFANSARTWKMTDDNPAVLVS